MKILLKFRLKIFTFVTAELENAMVHLKKSDFPIWLLVENNNKSLDYFIWCILMQLLFQIKIVSTRVGTIVDTYKNTYYNSTYIKDTTFLKIRNDVFQDI